jgi:S-adenosylmethionine:tRNA ribosyltransferase-isomerase
MRTELFDYVLPPERVAQRPPAERDGARMMVVREAGIEHRQVRELAELVPSGALFVVNETRVIRARLVGKRVPGGGRAEVFLLRRLERIDATSERWLALGRANRPLRPGSRVDVGGVLDIEVESVASGALQVVLRGARGVSEAIATVGHVPLPPYVKRPDDDADAERYQTVYGRSDGSVAAPTAGLHVTTAALERLAERGVIVGRVTLHVGLGTFRPVTSDDLDQHDMHEEYYEVSEELATQVDAARERGGPVVAVGTTVVRALESARSADDPTRVTPRGGWTRLLIQPGYRFGPVDALLTNFHMPRSTLVALVAAFVGRERLLDAYASAVAQEYRFLSYGDAMWIPERLA